MPDHKCHTATHAPTRRGFFGGLACAAALTGSAQAQFASGSAEDERFMRIAIDEARQADFPFGAVIVRDGMIISHGRNLGRTDRDPTAHGEMVAIRRCLAVNDRTVLMGSTLYTTGDPGVRHAIVPSACRSPSK